MHYTLKTPYTPDTPVSSHRSSRIEVLSPDGFWLAVGGLSDHTVVLFKAVEGAWRPWMTYYQHREGVYNRQGTIQALAWSPDGQQIASASSTGSIHVWAVRGRISAPSDERMKNRRKHYIGTKMDYRLWMKMERISRWPMSTCERYEQQLVSHAVFFSIRWRVR